MEPGIVTALTLETALEFERNVEAALAARKPRAITATLPYPISANRYWRPVTIGKHVTIVPTKDAKAYKADVHKACVLQCIGKPITGRARVEIDLYPQRPQDWAKRARLAPLTWDDDVRCIDLDNANKVLLDALKGVAIEDDRWVRELVSRRMEPDGEARVVVRITPLAVPASPQQDLLDTSADLLRTAADTIDTLDKLRRARDIVDAQPVPQEGRLIA